MRVEETDAIVVGMGATGGVAAKVLVEAGLSVIALEAGPWRESGDWAPDELSSWKFRNTVGTKFNLERPVHRADAESPTAEATASLGLMMNGVGGSSIHYGAWSRRYQPNDFRPLTETLERYGAASIPEGCTLTDWPISYDDLEPYYDHVEKAIGVSGVAANVVGKPQNTDGNPFEGQRSDEYPLPPLKTYEGGERFRAAASNLGYHPYSVPAAVISEDYKGRQGYAFPDDVVDLVGHAGAKSSTLVTTIPEALATGRLDLRALTRVTRILVETNRVIGVEAIGPDGETFRVMASRVLLGTYTYEAIRLLFLSADGAHSNGIGNRHGQLGKHFMTRNFTEVAGYFPDVDFRRLGGVTGQAVAFDDLIGDNFDHTGLGFLRGGTIGTENGIHPIGASKMIPPTVASWGAEYKRELRETWPHITFLRCQPEPLPYEGNELDIDPNSVEGGPLRMPRVRITYSTREDELRQSEYLFSRMEDVMGEMGASQYWRGPAVTGILSCHDVGGARMGDDPTTSVTDGYSQVHGVAGLFVLGGATFPTCPGINTTETLQAMAWRTAEFSIRQ